MSDDTPTERFDAAGDAPTERLNAAGDAPTQNLAAPSEEVVEERKSRRLILILSIIGGALLVAVLIVLILVLTRGNGTPGAMPSPSVSVSVSPSASATASAKPSATPSSSPAPTPSQTPSQAPQQPDPPQQETAPAFSQFNTKSSQGGCSAGGPGFDATRPTVQVQWKAVRADEAWIVTGTSDAVDSQYMQIPLNGDQNDFQYPVTLECGQDTTTFTITLLGSDGSHLSKSWTVKNTGDKF